MASASQESDGTYSFSLDASPEELPFIRGILDALAKNEGVTRIAIEVESETPLGLRQHLGPQSETSEPQPIPESSDASDETEDKEETFEVYPCENCDETFDSQSELAGHLRWCKDDESDIPEGYSLRPGTWKYKVAATLDGWDDGRLTPSEMESILDGTGWEQARKHLSGSLAQLAEDGVAERSERDESGPGMNPYEYWLTDAGQELISNAEAEAREQGVATFEDIDVEMTSETTEASVEEVEAAFECDTCGAGVSSSTDLSQHKLDEHDVPTPDDAAGNGRGVLAADRPSFYIASALANTSKPAIARNIEERLSDTDWEMDRKNISRELGAMHEAGVVERTERSSERGNPYEYVLTDYGQTWVDHVHKETGDESLTTFEEVIQGK